jgi:hypothetical protein
MPDVAESGTARGEEERERRYRGNKGGTKVYLNAAFLYVKYNFVHFSLRFSKLT